jgi:prepilin-type N-terminal cleavage/methylation domain-containing protein
MFYLVPPQCTTNLKQKGEWRMKMRKGFTLIEMLVVVAIIVALLTIIGFAGPALTKGAKVNAWKGSIKNIETAIAVYAQNTGTLPPAIPATPATGAEINAALATMGISKYMSGNIVDPFAPGTAINMGPAGATIIDLTAATANAIVLTYDPTTPAATTVDGVSVPHYTLSYKLDGTVITDSH